MNVANCRGCGRLFNVVTNRNLCPACLNELENKFQEVRKYLEENPLANINIVSEDCEVSVKQIKQWVREERLTFSESSMDGVACEKCGKMIRTGKYCDECKNKIANNLQTAYTSTPQRKEQKSTRDRDRMRFL